MAVTGATLTAYAFSLVGTGHVKVMASAFFAQKNTRTPMWGSLIALVVFTAVCAAAVGPWGTVGLGWANTVAMACFGLFLTILYARRYGYRGVRPGPVAAAVGRQVIAAAVMAVALRYSLPWLAAVDHTSLLGAARVSAVLTLAAVIYVGVATLLGGKELRLLASALKRGEPS